MISQLPSTSYNSATMKRILAYLLFTFVLLGSGIQSAIAQNINYETQVVRLYGDTYLDAVFGSEDKYQVFSRDNVNTGWDASPFYNVDAGALFNYPHPYQTTLINGTISNRTNTSASQVYLRLRAWEDESGECAPFCGGNSPTECDGCNGSWTCISDQDDNCCDNTIFNYNIRSTALCDWTNFSERECSNGTWGTSWRSRWNYTNGDALNTFLDLGEIRPCDGNTFLNSNKCYYSNQNSARAGTDVFYRIRLDGPMDLVISTCGSSYDTYLYLLNSSGTILAQNDDDCGVASRIFTPSTLPAGIYYVVVDGFASTSNGDHTLDISNNPSTGNIYRWVGSNSTNWFDACNWDRNALPNTNSQVFIPGTNMAPTQPTISGGIANSFTVEIDSDNGGLLTITDTGDLNITQP